MRCVFLSLEWFVLRVALRCTLCVRYPHMFLHCTLGVISCACSLDFIGRFINLGAVHSLKKYVVHTSVNAVLCMYGFLCVCMYVYHSCVHACLYVCMRLCTHVCVSVCAFFVDKYVCSWVGCQPLHMRVGVCMYVCTNKLPFTSYTHESELGTTSHKCNNTCDSLCQVNMYNSEFVCHPCFTHWFDSVNIIQRTSPSQHQVNAKSSQVSIKSTASQPQVNFNSTTS